MFIKGLRCVNCGEFFPLNPKFFVCPKCDVEKVCGVTVFKGITEVVYDYVAIGGVVSRELFSRRVFNALRYREFLGFGGDVELITLCEGGTPLIGSSRLAEYLKIKHLLLKNEAQNPTGSFKDRESLLAVNMALNFGLKSVSCVSSGNAASSIAAYAARAGLECYVFMPAKASRGKILQCLVYGAKTFLVDGIYEEIFEVHLEAIKGLNVLDVTPGYNRFRVEGDKTIAYEICEQLGWRVPDWIIDNVGNGTHLYGMWKGFKELYNLGFIDKLPRMVAVGPISGAPIVHCFKSGVISPLEGCGESIAEGLIAMWSYDAPLAIRALKESNGYAEYVSDYEILEAMKMLARFEGIFAEPSAVASIAVLPKLLESGVIDGKDEVVCLITGSGLKDPEGGSRISGNPMSIPLNVNSIRKVFQFK
ncbi:MAG: threonine synthase [archaeon GBS-70-058]|nr:threonine synthase [Candidatus Culexarchaeum nevadense]